MPYTPDKPPLPETSDQLRARIPGWGVDLDPADRPSVPKLASRPGLDGAPGDVPERQLEKVPRERSIEHGMLPPVFGTSCPPKGLSGVLRRYSYRRFSEGRRRTGCSCSPPTGWTHGKATCAPSPRCIQITRSPKRGC